MLQTESSAHGCSRHFNVYNCIWNDIHIWCICGVLASHRTLFRSIFHPIEIMTEISNKWKPIYVFWTKLNEVQSKMVCGSISKRTNTFGTFWFLFFSPLKRSVNRMQSPKPRFWFNSPECVCGNHLNNIWWNMFKLGEPSTFHHHGYVPLKAIRI